MLSDFTGAEKVYIACGYVVCFPFSPIYKQIGRTTPSTTPLQRAVRKRAKVL